MKFPSLGAVGVLSVCLLSSSAFAYSSGITGYSGIKGATVTCNTCHNGGRAPTVTLTGPTTLAAGETGQYALVITGGAGMRGGLNVAVDNTSASLTAGTGTKKVAGELTHTASKAASGGEIRFDFSLVAPSSAGTLKLFGSGNSANGDGDQTGDLSSSATLEISVTGGTTPGGKDEDKEPGCSSTGGSPGLLFALAAGVAVLRRRRS